MLKKFIIEKGQSSLYDKSPQKYTVYKGPLNVSDTRSDGCPTCCLSSKQGYEPHPSLCRHSPPCSSYYSPCPQHRPVQCRSSSSCHSTWPQYCADAGRFLVSVGHLDTPSHTADNLHKGRPHRMDHHTPHVQAWDTPGSTRARQGPCGAPYCSTQGAGDRNDILRKMVAQHHLAQTQPGAHPLQLLLPVQGHCLRSTVGSGESC